MRLPRSTPPQAAASYQPGAPLGILFENRDWQTDLLDHFERRGIPYEAIELRDAAFLLDEPDRCPIYLNRVSPSSYLRGNGPAIGFASTFLEALDAHRVRVINGASSFRLEVSKSSQHLLLRRLGVRTPATIVFNNRDSILELSRSFPFPAILKPDTGGSGALIRRVENREELAQLLDSDEDLFGPGHLLLLQEYIDSEQGTVTRLEFVDGELVYAMQVQPTNTYNLCPANTCVRRPANTTTGAAPKVEFAHFADIGADAIAQAREIIREARLDVGGVEFIETRSGDRCYYDINATSVYRDDVSQAAGVDGFDMLCDFVERERRKELLKRRGAGPDLRVRA
ncbi:MAG: hypothetical protein AAF581_03205 [Planctomycetota bacterium]